MKPNGTENTRRGKWSAHGANGGSNGYRRQSNRSVSRDELRRELRHEEPGWVWRPSLDSDDFDWLWGNR